MSEIKTVEVVIIGGGPAGAVCGYLLQKAGVDCLIVDHADFPRDKICGGGLTPKGWQLLEQIYPGLVYDYNPISRIHLVIDNQVHCEFSLGDERQHIRIVRRRDFDNILLNQYLETGGKFLHGSFADFSEDSSHADYPVEVVLRSGERLRCRYLVGADGATSQVRQRVDPESRHGLISMEQYQPVGASVPHTITIGMSSQYDHGYFYHFPNLTHHVVGFGDLRCSRERFADEAAAMGFPLISGERIRGAYIPRSSVVPKSDRILLIGDAGGFTNRVSYEGLYYAMATGRNASEAIVTGRSFREVNRVMYRKKRKEDFLDRLVYSHGGLATLKLILRSPRLVQAFYDFFV